MDVPLTPTAVLELVSSIIYNVGAPVFWNCAEDFLIAGCLFFFVFFLNI